MRIESIKARLEAHDQQRERFGYCDETAPQIWERELRALLKVAEAADNYLTWGGSVHAHALRAALAEVEAMA